MKCSNCGNEVDPNSAYCPVCGTKVGAEATPNPVEQASEPVVDNGYVAPAQEPVVEEPIQQQPIQEEIPVQQPVTQAQEPVYQEPVQQPIQQPVQPVVEQPVQQPVQPVVEQPVQQQPVQQAQPTYQAAPEPKKANNGSKHSVITLVGIIAVVAVVIGALCLVLFGSKSPEKIYKGMLSKAINESLAGDAATANSAIVESTVKISTDIDDAKDMLDGLAVDAKVQYDRAAQQAVVDLNVAKGKEKYLNLKAMGDLVAKVAAVEESNLYSKMVKADIPDEFYEGLEEVLGKDYTFETDAAANKKAAKILYSTIESNIKPEWFSKEKVTTQDNGKLTDNMLTIRETELEDLIVATVKSLRTNNDFLNCFTYRDEIVDMLDSIQDEVEDMSDEDVVYTVHLYTKGNKFAGAAIVHRDEYYEEEEIIEIEKKSKKEYEIRFETNDGSDLEVLQTIKVVANKLDTNDIDVEVTIDIEDEGYITVAATTNAKYNKSIELLDVSKAVDYTELTEDDMQEIMDNLQESPLYDLVEQFVGTTSTVSPTSEKRTPPSGVTLQAGQNFVASYDDDVIVFSVPNSFEEDYGGSSYVRFSKEDKTKYTAYVDVDCEWDTLDEYRDSIKSATEYYTEDNGYSKVKLSDEEQVKVGDRTFYKRTFTYTYGSYTANRTYYYTPVTDEYTYAVEIDDDDGIITDSEIEKLLTIQITLAK